MGSVSVVIKTPKLAADFVKAGQPKENLLRVIKLLTGIKAGTLQGAVFVQSSTSDPVAAAATATITYASLAAADTIVILGVTLTCTAGTPTANEFKKETDETVTAANLRNAINAHTTLSKYVTASRAAGVVTITSNVRGAIGNFLTAVSRTGTGITLAQWAGGAGGAATAPVQVRG